MKNSRLPTKKDITKEIKQVRQDLIQKIETAVLELDTCFGRRFDQLEGRFDQLEGRFNQLEGRFDQLMARFDKLEEFIHEDRKQRALLIMMVQRHDEKLRSL